MSRLEFVQLYNSRPQIIRLPPAAQKLPRNPQLATTATHCASTSKPNLQVALLINDIRHASKNPALAQLREDITGVYPYTVTELEVIVLSPHFLPGGKSLSVLPNEWRRLHSDNGDPVKDHTLWKNYHRGSGWHVVDEEGQPIRIAVCHGRDAQESLSLFALLVNTYHKLLDYSKRPIPDAFLRARVHGPSAVVFGQPLVHDWHLPTPSGSHSRVVIDEEGLDCDGDDYSSSDSSEKSDEDDELINGLTTTKMRTVIQQTGDGSLSGSERVNAAMLMFGMAGREALSWSAIATI
ncbi:unnamed protein product [Cyclocybe aegerita]|uniref:Uncharacterized protein n=1 Tax=Cyclocybe aegerita TaxID=1973307 RepID=A0A8S0XKI1_CYCAE|nr:unnamed protein product [Cyclocybe aegerita]